MTDKNKGGRPKGVKNGEGKFVPKPARPDMRRNPKTGLTEQQENFCRYLVKGYRLGEASRMAGYDGHPANASRRASNPRLKEYIAYLRSQETETAQEVSELEQQAADNKFADEDVTLRWLIAETRQNMREARIQGKFKDSNDSIKLIAQLSGYLKGSGDADEDEGVKRKLHGSEPKNQINLQVLNQYTERLADSRRDQPTALPAIALEVTPDLDGSVSDDGSGEAAGRLGRSDGEDDEAVS